MANITSNQDYDFCLCLEENPAGITQADIVVGLPSLNEAENIALPCRKASEGLKMFFPERSSVIINCDNDSQDGTKEAFFATETEVPKIYLSTPKGIKGKGYNLKNLFHKASQLGAEAVVILDANLQSIKRTWINSLVSPIFQQNAALVTPIYLRHKYDAPITSAVAYPLLRSLWGRRVRQPISVEFAFSGTLNNLFKNHAEWPNEDSGYALDMFMLTEAIIHGAPICQSFVPHPRITSMSLVDRDLPQRFDKVLTAIFNLMEGHYGIWSKITRSRPTLVFGADLSPQKVPPQPTISPAELYQMFKNWVPKVQDSWAKIFDQDKIAKLLKLTASPLSDFKLEITFWRDLVYNASLVYRSRSQSTEKQEVVSALIPLFLAKTLSFHLSTQDFTDQQVESFLEEEAKAFEAGKADLVSAWNTQTS